MKYLTVLRISSPDARRDWPVLILRAVRSPIHRPVSLLQFLRNIPTQLLVAEHNSNNMPPLLRILVHINVAASGVERCSIVEEHNVTGLRCHGGVHLTGELLDHVEGVFLVRGQFGQGRKPGAIFVTEEGAVLRHQSDLEFPIAVVRFVKKPMVGGFWDVTNPMVRLS